MPKPLKRSCLYTSEEVDELMRLRRQGLTFQQIADRLASDGLERHSASSIALRVGREDPYCLHVPPVLSTVAGIDRGPGVGFGNSPSSFLKRIAP